MANQDVAFRHMDAVPSAGSASEETASCLVVGLAKIGMAVRHQAWEASEHQGLTPTQGQILALLRSQPRGLLVSKLAEGLAITSATTTVALQALQRKGLVRKARSPLDGRARIITLTEAGQAEAARAATWSDFLLNAVDTLTTEEQAVFLRSLSKMIRTLQVRGEIPVSRMCVTCHYFRPNAHPGAAALHHCAFVDAPFGDGELRLECPDHVSALPAEDERHWEAFLAREAS